MLQLWGVSLRILHGLSFPLGKHVFMHHPTLSLFRPSDHPPGGLQRRTPNRNCLYSVLLLRQGLLHKLSDHTEERYEIPKIFNQKFPRFSIISPSSTPSHHFWQGLFPSSPRRTAFLNSRTMSLYHFTCPSLSVLRTTRLPVSASYSFFQQNNPISAGADVHEAYRISLLQAEIAFFKYNTYLCSIWFSTVRDRWLTWRW